MMSRDPDLFLKSAEHSSIPSGLKLRSPTSDKCPSGPISASPLAGHLEQLLCLKESFGVSDVESEIARSHCLFSKCIEPILSLQHQQDPERVARTAAVFLPELVQNNSLISDFISFMCMCMCVVPSFHDQTLSKREKYLKVLTRTNDTVVNVGFDNICALGSVI